ncbi:discoidin domain-containing protein [Dactylosporangium sp. NPDC049525]|uniref:galactose-binding domain-containing protein n=1 Tax=Dactylosporangium sp. NPDC049525 TaxID=3154730 RepID=UPI00342F35A7
MNTSRARWRLLCAALVTGLLAAATPGVPALAAGGPNLAIGRPASAGGANAGYGPNNITDGNPNTYWEGPVNAFPQWVQVDLGAAASIDQVVLKLPPAWGTRTQTLSVSGSADGSNFTVLAPSAGRVFNPATANTVTIGLAPAGVRYVRVTFSANTGWPAAQLAELEVSGAAGATPDLAAGKPLTASSALPGYAAGNAHDGNRGTYWESTNNAWPQWLQVDLGAAVTVSRVVLRLPAHWGTRTQTLAVQGSTTGTAFTDLVTSSGYVFNPADANTVTIAFPATATRYVRLLITANTAQPGGQVAEFEVYGPGTGDGKPDLTVAAAGWSPAAPTESTPITLAATVANTGAAASAPTNVNFYVVPNPGPAVLPPVAATAPVGALAPGTSVTVTATIGARAAGAHVITARVDEANAVVEQNELNNSYTNPANMLVSALPASDIVLAQVSWTPTTPAAGTTVAFSVSIRNQGTIATSADPHSIAVTVLSSTGAVVHTTGGTYAGAIPPGGTAGPVSAGTWTAASGEYLVRITLVPDANETPPRQGNNTGTYVLSV